jgi:hypothetical protein
MFSRRVKLVQVHDSWWTMVQCLPEFVILTSNISTMHGLQEIVKKFHVSEGAQHTIVLQVFAKDKLRENLLDSLGMSFKIQ